MWIAGHYPFHRKFCWLELTHWHIKLFFSVYYHISPWWEIVKPGPIAVCRTTMWVVTVHSLGAVCKFAKKMIYLRIPRHLTLGDLPVWSSKAEWLLSLHQKTLYLCLFMHEGKVGWDICLWVCLCAYFLPTKKKNKLRNPNLHYLLRNMSNACFLRLLL